MTQEKMSPLRARMIEDMRIRGMAETSQKAHIRAMSKVCGCCHREMQRRQI